jgi:hypothetical protein
MALTMTRTRTQTALTKLAELLANLHGELAMVERLLTAYPEHQAGLAVRKDKLTADIEALCLTLKQFDPKIDPSHIGALDQWWKPYGRLGTKTALRRYLLSLGKQ